MVESVHRTDEQNHCWNQRTAEQLMQTWIEEEQNYEGRQREEEG